MKNFRFLLSFVLLAFISISAHSQEALAVVDFSTVKNFSELPVEVHTVSDEEAFSQIAKYLTANATHPFSRLAFANEVEVKIQIALNEEGRVIDSRVVSSSDKAFGKEIKDLVDRMPQIGM